MTVHHRIFEDLLGKRLMTAHGELRVDGLRGSVSIRRDAFGIPYIEADHERDAWYGLGFAQAQDRAFQLEIFLRLVRGTMAAITGSDSLPMDRLSRRIGFR